MSFDVPSPYCVGYQLHPDSSLSSMHDPSKMKDASAVKLKDLHFQGRQQSYLKSPFHFTEMHWFPLLSLFQPFSSNWGLWERERALYNKLIQVRFRCYISQWTSVVFTKSKIQPTHLIMHAKYIIAHHYHLYLDFVYICVCIYCECEAFIRIMPQIVTLAFKIRLLLIVLQDLWRTRALCSGGKICLQ